MKYLKLAILFSLLLALPSFASIENLTRQYFSDAGTIDMTLSPSGIKVAQIKLEGGETSVWITDNENGSESLVFNVEAYTKNDAIVSSITWIDDKYLALQFSEIREGIKDLLHTKLSSRLLILNTAKLPILEDSVLSVRTAGQMVHALPNEPGVLLYSKSGLFSKIYRIDVSKLASDKAKSGKLDRIDGGQFTKSNQIKSIESYVLRWYFGTNSKPEAALTINKDGDLKLVAFDKGKETHLKEWGDKKTKSKSKQKEPQLVPLVMGPNNHTFYSLDLNEGEERSVYEVDYKNNKNQKIYETGAYKIVKILLSPNGEFVGVSVLRDGVLINEFADRNHTIESTKHSDTLFTVFEDTPLFQLAYKISGTSPGQYLLIDKSSKETKAVGRSFPKIPEKTSTIEHGYVTVGDLKIPYILNIPSSKKAVPLLVMPHGGPIDVYDSPYFDPLTHYFVAQNLAVLRVNFRGSSGHSEKLKKAGDKQWGNLMLEDIFSATKKASSHPQIDANRICITGFSYGAYAAVSLLIKHPEIYRCASSTAGVYDVNLFINSKLVDGNSDEWLFEKIGNPNSEHETLKEISPVYNAQHLKRPLLIAHGEKDEIVDIEHAYRLKLMLDKHKKDYEWLTFKELGHSTDSSESTVQLMMTISKFLKKHLY